MALVPRARQLGLAATAAGLVANEAFRSIGRYGPGYVGRAAQYALNKAMSYNYTRTGGTKRARTGNFTRAGARRAFKGSYRSSNKRTGGFVGTENKFIDTSLNAFSIAENSDMTRAPILDRSLTVVDHLSPVPQGTGPSERIGRNIWVESISLKGYAEIPAVDTIFAGQVIAKAAPPTATIIFVLDKQANNTTPAAAVIWDNPANDQKLGGYPLINLEYKDRFKILGTRHIEFAECIQTNTRVDSGDTHQSSTGVIKYYNFFKKFKNPKKQQYDGTSGNITSITDWAVSMWVQTTTDFTPSTRFGMFCRTRYRG